MLTKITAYSQWTTVDPLVLNVVNRPDDDLFEIRNVDGLGAVAASVNTTPLAVDGEAFTGTNVGKRNIVLTVGLSPDWDEWTMSRLRRVLDKYFTPKQTIRLVFETQEFSPVEIFGYIESNEPNIFSKDPEHVISIICPDVYFKSVDPTVINGNTTMSPLAIDYEGNVETGFELFAARVFGTDPTWAKVRVNDPLENSIQIDDPAAFNENLRFSSIPGNKYIRRVGLTGAILENLLNSAVIVDANDRIKRWPVIGPGTVDFAVTSDVQLSWVLTYYNTFGSL